MTENQGNRRSCLQEGAHLHGLEDGFSFVKEKNEYGEAFPRITFLVDGRYVRLPIESDTLQELGSFIMKMGKALEGVKVPDDELNMDRIRDRIRACGGVIEQSADDRE